MDKKEVTDILKNEGLYIAEDLAAQATKAAIALLRQVLPKVSVVLGTLFNALMSMYEKKIFTLIDKIDGRINA